MDIHPDLLGVINQVRVNKALPSFAALTPSARLREDLGFESLDLAELTVRIEERFGVDVFADGIVNRVEELQAKINPAA